MMENRGEEDSVKAAGLGALSNYVPRSELPVEIPEESGQSKRKRVQKLADALNRCLCGMVHWVGYSNANKSALRLSE